MRASNIGEGFKQTMIVLNGLEAFEWTKLHNLSLRTNQRALYKHHLAGVEPDLARHVEDPVLDGLLDAEFGPEDEERVRGLVEEYGPEVFATLVESYDPAGDEEKIIYALHLLLADPKGPFLHATASDILEKLDASELPPFGETPEGYAEEDFEENYEPWAYNICLRLVERGTLRTRLSEPGASADTFKQLREGEFLFEIVQPLDERIPEAGRNPVITVVSTQ